jgi:GT2 family glycosyltransferase
MKLPNVSIVLPTFRREDLLCRALGDLLRQQWRGCEIIVVDQTPCHTPETQAYLNEIKERILYLRRERPGVVEAANHGVKASNGEIVLFVDDDIRIPDPEFVALHVRNYDDPSIGGVAGRVLDAREPKTGVFDPRSADPVWGFFHTGWDHEVPCEVTTAPGANMSFRREVMLRVGEFDERFVGNAFRWENDFCLRVRKAGYRVVYDPRPTVHHYYGSPGGNDNRHLLGRELASHGWYRDFFRNQMYVSLKHMPRLLLPVLLWRLYRGHVMNRPYVREGVGFLLARHLAFVGGLAKGWQSFRQWHMGGLL